MDSKEVFICTGRRYRCQISWFKWEKFRNLQRSTENVINRKFKFLLNIKEQWRLTAHISLSWHLRNHEQLF